MKNKAFIMVSGGMDSTTAIAELKNKYELNAIFFDYGQKSIYYDLSTVRRICIYYKIPFNLIDISGLKNAFLGLSDDISIPIGFGYRGHPNCPHALFGIATSYTLLNDSEILINAINSIDYLNMPSVKEYVSSYSETIRKLHLNNFQFITPYLEIDKKSIVEIGLKLDVPYEMTRSCTNDYENHCGMCKACKDRKEAFTGRLDSTKYLK